MLCAFGFLANVTELCGWNYAARFFSLVVCCKSERFYTCRISLGFYQMFVCVCVCGVVDGCFNTSIVVVP